MKTMSIEVMLILVVCLALVIIGGGTMIDDHVYAQSMKPREARTWLAKLLS